MTVKMRPTGRTLVGYDKDNGRVVRRKVYSDINGRRYVRLGTYALYQPDACVTADWFCDHVLKDGAIER